MAGTNNAQLVHARFAVYSTAVNKDRSSTSFSPPIHLLPPYLQPRPSHAVSLFLGRTVNVDMTLQCGVWKILRRTNIDLG